MLGDKERTLRLDFNALSKAEEVTGKNFVEVLTWQELNAREVRALAWACLVHEDPALTIEDVGRLLTRTTERVVSDALLELYIGEVAAAGIDKDPEKAAKDSFVTAGGGEKQ